jgi:hypothetical protein
MYAAYEMTTPPGICPPMWHGWQGAWRIEAHHLGRVVGHVFPIEGIDVGELAQMVADRLNEKLNAQQ